MIFNTFLETCIIVIGYSIIFFAFIDIGYSIMSQAIEKKSISILFPITKIYQIEKWLEARTANSSKFKNCNLKTLHCQIVHHFLTYTYLFERNETTHFNEIDVDQFLVSNDRSITLLDHFSAIRQIYKKYTSILASSVLHLKGCFQKKS